MRGDQPGSRGAAMSRTATYFCWACWAPWPDAEGCCPACGHAMRAAPGDLIHRAAALGAGHPLVERRMVAECAGRTGRAAGRAPLAGACRRRPRPLLAAAALRPRCAIESPEASRAAALGRADGPVPVAASRNSSSTPPTGDRQVDGGRQRFRGRAGARADDL